MKLNKYFQALVVAGGATFFATTSALAHHGQQYLVSACDKDGTNTANMLITTVGHHNEQENVREILQSTFSKLMQRHSAQAHSKITGDFVSDLIASFNKVTTDVMDAVQKDEIYLDFHHPRASRGGPVTPGCKADALKLTGGK